MTQAVFCPARTMPPVARTLLGLALALVLDGACADLPPVQTGVCGNRVVEEHEECDWFAQGEFECRRADVSQGGCRLQCKSDRTCPVGYGCGVDGLCRKPSGTFDYENPARIAGRTRHVRLDDFDGDHRADVVAGTLTDLRVHFFDGKSAPAHTVQLPWVGPAATGVLTTDGLPSLAVGRGGALAVWRGRSDRSLGAVLYPTVPLPTTNKLRLFVADGLSAQAGPAFAGDELFFAETVEPGTGVFPAAQASGSLITLFTVPRPLGELVGPAIGRFRYLPQCDGVAYGLDKSTKVHVHDLCFLDGRWAQNSEPRIVTALGTLDATTSHVVAGRVNGDELADLVVQHTLGVDVVYANSVGGFDSALPFPGYAPTGTTVPDVLAVGDLDGDDKGDLVDSAGLWLTSIGNAGAYAYTAKLTSATIVDLNGDKKSDVVAATALGTVLFLGTGSQLLNPAFYALDDTPAQMTVADFDGDLLPDILVATTAADETTSLWVQWSRPGQFPEAPAFVGTLPALASMTSGRLTPSLSANHVLSSTAMAPILVRKGDGTLQAPLLLGDVSRILTSPFVLRKAPDISGEMASLVLGHFDSSGHAGLAALAFDLDLKANPNDKLPRAAHLWLVPSQGEAEVDPANVLRSEPPMPLGSAVDGTTLQAWQEPLVVAIDLDRDGVDEVLTLAPPTLLPPPLPTAGKLFVSKVGDTGFETSSGIDIGGADSNRSAWRLHVTDVDGDGFLDVLILYPDANGQPRLRVLRNDGDATIDEKRWLDVPTPWIALGESATALATVRTDATSPRRSVALLASKHLWLIPWAQNGASFGTPVFQSPNAGPSIPGGQSIAAGDVDGDGVEDLVLGDEQGLVVYFGKELAP